MMLRSMSLVLLLLTACGSVPMAPQADDAAGKRFSALAPGVAALYVYRADTIGGLRTVDVSAGQRMLGALAWHTWLRVDLPPGRQDIRCKFENTTSLPVSLSAGEIRYLEISFSIGTCHLQEVPAAKAQPAIISGRRAAEVQ